MNSQSARRRMRRHRRNQLRNLAQRSFEPLEPRRLLAVFTVNSTGDTVDATDGFLTLREAILEANSTANVGGAADVIQFAVLPNDAGHLYYQDDGVNGQVSESSVAATTANDDSTIGDIDPDWPHSWYRITPLSALPTITEAVTIDGFSQAGASANTSPLSDPLNAILQVELVGAGAGLGGDGIVMASDGSRVQGLVIGQFGGDGVHILDSSNNILSGNFIGTDVSGTLDRGNRGEGVLIEGLTSESAENNLVGGAEPASQNLISANEQYGVVISDGVFNRIVGNRIVFNDRYGVALFNPTTVDNQIESNDISNNGQGGVLAQNSGSNVIGGPAGAGNTIAFNNGNGVTVLAVPTVSIQKGIIANSIHSNTGLGIDLGDDGVTANDSGDGDIGANNLQNYPILETARSGIDTTILGVFDSLPDTNFRLDFFSNTAADPSGFGEGETWIGATTVRTDASGMIHLDITLPDVHVPAGLLISATATNLSTTDTSEFSNAVDVASEFDFGDAPDGTGDGPSYATLLASDGARHAIVPNGPFIGSISPDVDVDGQPDLQATGDDLVGQDDEDGLEQGNFVLIPGATFRLFLKQGQVDGGVLNAWIDYNRDGIWDNTPGSDEHIISNLSVGGQGFIQTVNISVPRDAMEGISFGRFRISSQADLGPTGAAPDGEVEDHLFVISGLDYGDAPDNFYSTTFANDGARHANLRGTGDGLLPFALGTLIDTESDGQPGPLANGDDTTGVNDDDGVSGLDQPLQPGTNHPITITATVPPDVNEAWLTGWIDFNRDGDFDDRGELVIDEFLDPPLSGPINLNILVPSDATVGPSFARFRLTSESGINFDGLAKDGEVEDYAITIGEAACSLIVTNTADSGFGSLREAIDCANATPGLDTVTFAIPGAGPYTIQPLGNLPTITDEIIINGRSQPSFAGTPVIEIDGSLAGTGTAGTGATAFVLVGGAGGSTIDSLVINRFTGRAIEIADATGGHTLTNNYIGTTLDGMSAAPNGGPDLSGAIWVGSDAGGNTFTDNLVSGNHNIGMLVGSDGNTFERNAIGTDPSGTLDVGNGTDGLMLLGSSNLVRNNVISGNGDNGLTIQQGGESNQVVANRIGTDTTGMVALGNDSRGVLLNGSNNTIGGVSEADGNVISGNGSSGIGIGSSTNLIVGNLIGTNANGTSAIPNQNGISLFAGQGNRMASNVISGNRADGIGINQGGQTVQGNRIGTNAAGDAAVPNQNEGINIQNADGNVIGVDASGQGEGNLISGNGRSGIRINEIGSRNNLIAGNLIGTDLTGTAAIGNGVAGVDIGNGATLNLVGGLAESARNIISGNQGAAGVVFFSGATENDVQGNYIGVDITGSNPLPNRSGVLIETGTRNRIGGTQAGAGNVISGNNQDGVAISGNASTGNVVQGNWIGVDRSEAIAIGNGFSGMHIRGGALDNLIGGTVPEAGNVIAFNSGAGVLVESGTGNSILRNQITRNESLGIDLGGDGVTTNDSQDADTGANDLQNFPVITSVIVGTTATTITGTLNSVPDETYLVQFFANEVADPSGFGEGKTFIGEATVTTDVGGDAAIQLDADLLPIGTLVTATATRVAGQTFASTSEFSLAIAAQLLGPVLTVSKTDRLAVDSDQNQAANPGDVLEYTILIHSSGDEDALDVQVNDALDPNTTLVADSVRVTPLALDDVYRISPETTFTVDAAGGLLANDFDIDGAAPGTNQELTLVTQSIVRTGGTVMGELQVNGDGSLTYTTPIGSRGIETFAYNVMDADGLEAIVPGIITFNSDSNIWFVDNSREVNGDGSFENPFNSFAPINGVNDVDEPGDTIFVFAGSQPYDQQVDLEDNQQLIGEGMGFTVGGTELVPPGTRPTFTNQATDGIAIVLANNNTLRGLDISASDGSGIRGEAVAGGTIEHVSIASAGDHGLVFVDVLGTWVLNQIVITGVATNGIRINGGLPSASFDIDQIEILNSGESGLVVNQFAGRLTAGNRDDSKLDDVIIRNPGSAFPAVQIQASPTGRFELVDLDIDDVRSDGVDLNHAGSVVVFGGTIDGTTGDGIHSTNTSLNTNVLQIGSFGDIGGDGIEIRQSDDVARQVTVLNSNIGLGLSEIVRDRGIAIIAGGTATLTADLRFNMIVSTNQTIYTIDDGQTASLVLDLQNSTLSTDAVGTPTEQHIGLGQDSTIIRSWASPNQVIGGVTSGGSGIVFDGITFDASGTDLLGDQVVLGGMGDLTIGTSVGRVRGNGLVLNQVSGNLRIPKLNIFNDGGVGLLSDTTGRTFVFEANGGTIDSLGGPGIQARNFTRATIANTNVTGGDGFRGVEVTLDQAGLMSEIISVGNTWTARSGGNASGVVISTANTAQLCLHAVDNQNVGSGIGFFGLELLQSGASVLAITQADSLDFGLDNPLTTSVNTVGTITFGCAITSNPASITGTSTPHFDSNQILSDAVPSIVLANIPTVPTGKAVEITFLASINEEVPQGVTAVTNQAEVTGSNFAAVKSNDPDTPAINDPTTTPIEVTEEAADLSLTKSVDDSNPDLNQEVTFMLTLRNAGPDDATGVSVLDQLPEGLKFLRANTDYGSYDAATGVWNIGPVPADSAMTVTLEIVAEFTAEDSYRNTAEILTSDQPDPDSTPGNGVAGEDDQSSVFVGACLTGGPLTVGANLFTYSCVTPGGFAGFVMGTKPGRTTFERWGSTVDIANATMPAIGVANNLQGVARVVIELTEDDLAHDLIFQAFEMVPTPKVSNTLEFPIQPPDQVPPPAQPLDVNRDGKVSALDALVIINRINAEEAQGAAGERVPGPTLKTEFDYDANGDGKVTALDALNVINYLARTDSTSESERATTVDAVMSPPLFDSSLRATEIDEELLEWLSGSQVF